MSDVIKVTIEYDGTVEIINMDVSSYDNHIKLMAFYELMRDTVYNMEAIHSWNI